MKTQFFKIGILGMAAAALPLITGCNQSSAPSFVTTASAEPAIAPTNAPVATPIPDSPSTIAAKPEPAPVAPDKKVLPANINPTTPMAEVVKLAQSGVDEGVMLSYVTNSTKTFNVGSDEIIYLNDLGVPNSVVTTMIEHDKAMKEFWANAAQQPAAPSPPAPVNETDANAAAPSYVNPPQAASVEPPAANVSYNYFYDTLSPYGSWVNVDGYGMCWQPTVVVANRGWQPYCDRGRWVYSDSGWYWLSDYSWGATTFHYGRWFNHARWGWCWWPDRVWAPSWVAWRYSGDYCGWAPLPPAAYFQPGFGFSFHGRSVGFSFDFGIGASWFTFVPTARICDPRPYHYRLPSHQVTKIYNNTTVINNYGSGNNNRVINRGISPERIRSVSKAEIRQVSIRDASTAGGRSNIRSERLDHDGRTLVVNRPHISGDREDLNRRQNINAARTTPLSPAATTDNSRGNVSRTSPAAPGQNNEDRRAARTPGNPAASTPSRTVEPARTPKNFETPSRDRRNEDRGTGRNNGAQLAQPNVTPASPAQVNSPAPAPAKPAPPASSLSVIGKKDGGLSPTRGSSSTFQSPGRPAPGNWPPAQGNQSAQPSVTTAPQSQVPAPTHNWSQNTQQRIQRYESPRASGEFENRATTRPSYSVPAPAPRAIAPATPNYAPPVSTPAPRSYGSPTYTPTPRSSRSESPAPVVAPRPSAAPSYSPPISSPRAQSAAPPSRSESRSESGQKGRNRN